ncbi:MAG: YkgJ family cysteine cluster protein [Dehalococcoidia bacterium]|nr:YkgJ family cysteine cluster protein [Dehalococcoidia bacterium]
MSPDSFEINRRIAYLGETGRRREEFCRKYIAMKETALPAMSEKLLEESEEAGKTISCGRGCGVCCCMFVVASLQECDAIVYHLYNHAAAMRVFQRNFARWNARILKIADTFRSVNDLHASITAGEASADEKSRFDAACGSYALAGNSCPFLEKDACSIYPVRPYVCASIVSLTPAEWCWVGHPRYAEVFLLKAQLNYDKDMPYFEKTSSVSIFSSMPFLVWRILNSGYDALSDVPGLGHLKSQAYAHPEVQAALREMNAVS